MLDISENGRQIGEKLLAILDEKQKRELQNYLLEEEIPLSPKSSIGITVSHPLLEYAKQPLTEICHGDLYVCLEYRIVRVQGREMDLTVKEFDILALLICNPRRVFTYEMIIDIVWHENFDYYSRKAVNNHVSNLRRKLKITPNSPEYIKSVRSIGYKFEL